MKHKNNSDLPTPFKILQFFTKSFSGVWDLCDDIHNHNGKDGLPKWNTICDLPISASLSIMTHYREQGISASIELFPELCSCLYSWRRYKEIYSFDKDLAELLMNQVSEDDDLLIPMDVLMAMPYPCIYITINDFEDFEGFWVWFESDVNNGELELRFLFVKNNGKFGKGILHLKQGYTISDAIERSIEISIENLNNKELKQHYKEMGVSLADDLEFEKLTKSELDEFKEEMKNELQSILQLVLYVCADNKEVESSKTIKRRENIKPTDKPKDVFREIQEWEVGYRIGNTIRKYNSEHHSENSTTYTLGTGSKKRPHSRRGHWHHYWCGSDKDGTRKLLLKWTAPMFINGDSGDDIPTVHKVKK